MENINIAVKIEKILQYILISIDIGGVKTLPDFLYPIGHVISTVSGFSRAALTLSVQSHVFV